MEKRKERRYIPEEEKRPKERFSKKDRRVLKQLPKHGEPEPEEDEDTE